MPLQATSGAASYDGFGGGVAAVPNYIEDVFSTWLYQADGSSTQTINNGIDLAGEGGLVWIKSRSNATGHVLVDTARGSPYVIQSNSTNAQGNWTNEFGSFSSTGFTVPYNTVYGETNFQTRTYTSWTFRKQPKFFDVVTYTGNGVDDRQIAHSLGSTPGCVMIKRTDSTSDWVVSHNYDFGNVLFLNTTAAAIANPSSNGYFGYPANPLQPTYFTLGTNAATNASGGSYVAYVFASDAGGFGLTGTDSVISCGSFTTDSFKTGYASLPFSEAQWILVKCADNAGQWFIVDNMRGIYTNYVDANGLSANTSAAETTRNIDYGNSSSNSQFRIFGGDGVANATYIYIAIRRGPMKVPTSGTSVFAASTYTGDDSSNREITGLSFTPDLMINAMRAENGSGRSPAGFYWFDRLRGKGARLRSSQTLAEYLVGPAYEGVNFNSYSVDAASGESNYNPALYLTHLFKRAPSFFDEVCYTGLGYPTALTNTHNLGVAPEMMIVKNRSNTQSWFVYHSAMGNAQEMYLNQSASQQPTTYDWNSTTPSATTFTVNSSTNNSGQTYVAYLFATCAGVSKVGSYTGNGTTQTINCGFTGGARFVLIKRTDSTGDWYVWDSARGIVSGNDPYLLLNSTSAEVTSTDYIDTYSAGFEISSSAPSAINASGGTFIFLAIA